MISIIISGMVHSFYDTYIKTESKQKFFIIINVLTVTPFSIQVNLTLNF